ncbi:MAG: TetR/AcrR family transcriptional regulator [Oscillospiraceae bacterium]|nr:TetR/AcrR family transcriptional regulator [Oscillospiraceae bacterium]
MKGEKGEKRKQELVSIAYRMFIQKGYKETSIDEIIAEAHIAKGTYYYHFPSKDALLEEVIGMMINEEVQKAKEVLSAPIPVPQKMVGIIAALRPGQEESSISDTLNRKENIIMHEKVSECIVEAAVPLLTEAVSEGIAQGIFSCDHIKERVRMILILSQNVFDSDSFTEGDIEVFIDMTEKTLGAEPGTLGFIRQLIQG